MLKIESKSIKKVTEGLDELGNCFTFKTLVGFSKLQLFMENKHPLPEFFVLFINALDLRIDWTTKI